jgi:cobalt/nickel transport system permease protein
LYQNRVTKIRIVLKIRENFIMHMADALLSPVVGGAMCAVSAGTIAYCSGKVRRDLDDSKVPLMGVLGAFIFAAQMINFTIPVTGSSGHLGGGLILAILLGPYAAFLTIASVLVVQALFFADGGLLALGCNIFNLGFFPAFIAYPFIYKKIIGSTPSTAKISVASIMGAIAGLQMGAFGVVLETFFSRISSLPFSTFVAMMQPIHLAIGIVEGLVTATVVSFVYKARPEIMQSALEARPIGSHPVRNVILAFLALAVVTGGIVSGFASNNPDGLEWSLSKVTGQEKLKGPEQGLHAALAALQEKIAFLPDYSFKKPAEAKRGKINHDDKKSAGPGNGLGTSISGLVGGMTTLGLALLIGFILKRRNQTA